MYQGINKSSGKKITDIEHINQCIEDIITTPIGTRIMRRDYGSVIFDLIDAPQNDVLKLKIMSAIYTAISRWENRVRLVSINLYPENSGKLTVDYQAIRTDTQEQISSSVQIQYFSN